MPKTEPNNRQVSARILAALIGNYAFSWGFCALGITTMVALGSDFNEAEQLVYLLVFPLYLSIFLWAFSAKIIARVWLILFLGSLVMNGSAWTLQHLIIS